MQRTLSVGGAELVNGAIEWGFDASPYSLSVVQCILYTVHCTCFHVCMAHLEHTTTHSQVCVANVEELNGFWR